MPEREYQKTTTVKEAIHPDTTETVVVEQPVVQRKLIDNDVVTTRTTAESVVYYILDVIEILLALRLIFRLLGANPNSGIVSFLYGVTAPFVAPFAGIFRQPVVAGSVLEWSTVIAMIIYALIAYMIVQLIRISYRNQSVR